MNHSGRTGLAMETNREDRDERRPDPGLFCHDGSFALMQSGGRDLGNLGRDHLRFARLSTPLVASRRRLIAQNWNFFKELRNGRMDVACQCGIGSIFRDFCENLAQFSGKRRLKK
jgi:hypothetical protein